MQAEPSAPDWDSAGPSAEWTLADFEIGRPLGKGHFGTVYLGRAKRADGFLLVLKCLQKKDIEAQGSEVQVRREIEIMKRLRHPNIIRLFGWFHDTSRVFMMMEYAGQGELYKHLAKAGKFSEKRSSRYIRQVALGLAYLHEHNVIHRDIKPENLLLGMEGEVKIGDFGWSVHSPEERQRTIAGTLSYVSPEMILGQPYGRAVDAWALGVLTYEFLCGHEPFGAEMDLGNRSTTSLPTPESNAEYQSSSHGSVAWTYVTQPMFLRNQLPSCPVYSNTIQLQDSLWDLYPLIHGLYVITRTKDDEYEHALWMYKAHTERNEG